MEKQCQKHNIIQMLKSHSPSLPSLRRLTPFIIPQKNNSCHFYIFIISVYISNVFASLVVQF